ncbi:uncharacterized protein EDB91DRAFT_1078533 [Suillus paluster]|uniref:uncharacterized protein n=1 Tax=Suillus paluster TaxID=48578 RepID=UPI001B85D591|nr:uncharacterized protein EDB91DRAFT_1078533 [Suillus paluster]KAG1750513.1 hypothetical protein EDB91DRAFT_1078533 [Suillus paluster]
MHRNGLPTILEARDSIPTTPKHVGVKRSRSEPPTPSPTKSGILSDDEEGPNTEGHAPRKKKLMRLYLSSPNSRPYHSPLCTAPEYLEVLNKRKTPESPEPPS